MPQFDGHTALEYLNRARTNNTIIIPEFLPRIKLLKLIALADLVVLPYSDIRTQYVVSGVFHIVIGSRKPVICSKDHRLIECNVIAPELTLNKLTPEELSLKLGKLVESRSHFDEAIERLWMYALETRWCNIARKHLKVYKDILRSASSN